jgi:hypothetical protein
MAEFYWDRFREAEQRRDFASRDFFGSSVGSFHDGRYARSSAATALSASTPAPAGDVTFYRFEERPIQQATDPGISDDAVARYRSRWAAISRSEEGRLAIPGIRSSSRTRQWRGTVRSFLEKQIGEGFVHVPADASKPEAKKSADGRFPEPRSGSTTSSSLALR